MLRYYFEDTNDGEEGANLGFATLTSMGGLEMISLSESPMVPLRRRTMNTFQKSNRKYLWNTCLWTPLMVRSARKTKRHRQAKIGGMHITKIMIIIGATNARPCSTNGKESTKSPSGSQYSFSFAAVKDKDIAAVGMEKDIITNAERQMFRACLMNRRRIVLSKLDHIMSPLVGAELQPEK